MSASAPSFRLSRPLGQPGPGARMRSPFRDRDLPRGPLACRAKHAGATGPGFRRHQARFHSRPPRKPLGRRTGFVALGVTSRSAVACVGISAVIALACVLGWLCGLLSAGLRPWALYETITAKINQAGSFGAAVIDAIASALPWMADFIEALRPALPNLAGVTVIWAVVRVAELVLDSITRDPRDQSFALRVPLQLAVIPALCIDRVHGRLGARGRNLRYGAAPLDRWIRGGGHRCRCGGAAGCGPRAGCAALLDQFAAACHRAQAVRRRGGTTALARCSI